MDLLEEIKKAYERMSKGQKKIADYILKHPDQAAFLTAAKLGSAADVSESTVVRFAMMLGYDGYTEFQEAFAGKVQERLNTPAAMKTNIYRENHSEILKGVLVSDAQNIVDSIHLVDSALFEQAVENIEGARKVYIVGLRSCAPLASYLAYYLGMLRDGVSAVTSPNVSEIFEQLYWIGPEDVLIGISFPRYSLRTLRAMAFGNERSARLIAITDSEYSPINMYSSCNLWAKSDMVTIAESLVAPMSLINALVVALFMRGEDKATERLRELDRIWSDYQTYAPDDLSGMEGEDG